jgi:hypothetical protein
LDRGSIVAFDTGGETVIIKRRSGNASDEYGNKIYSLTSISVHNVLIGFGASGEPTQVDRDPIDAKLTLYFPNGTAIEDGDTFVIRGQEWDKDGQAQDFKPPFDFSAGVVVPVKKRNG